ncbi:MAG: hypothetical protein ABJG15_16320 [Hyphomonadaceae bacterium]
MSDDKLESLKKRLAARQDAALQRLKQNHGSRLSAMPSQNRPTPPVGAEPPGIQAAMQTKCAMFETHADTLPIGAPLDLVAEATPATARPAAPTGKWRCVVNSPVVSIDLVANIAGNGSLAGQGTIVYVHTSRIFQVSGQGDWTALPPDPNATSWLFKFRLQPSNHAIFSWFAAPTQSPNHLQNRFVIPDNKGIVETNCERIG